MKALADLIQSIVMDKKEVVVGTVDLSLVAKWDKIQVEHDKAHEEIKTQIDAFIEKLKAEHKPLCKVYKRRELDVMKEILIAAGIPESEHEREYSVNKLTGEVARIDMEIDPRLKEAFMSGENPFKKA
jgi:hypothetical protein